jgi:glycosyltransferase involved in cell wall biosynthesis
MICVGNLTEGYGLSKAFDMNCRALSTVVEIVPVPFETKLISTSHDIYLYGLPKQCLKFVQQNQEICRSVRVICNLICETDTFEPRYKLLEPFVSEIWTASSFCADVFRKVFNKPVFVVPHVIDHPETQVTRSYTAPTNFLFMFDGGSRVLRKNPYGLISVFNELDDDVHLTIKTKNLDPFYFEVLFNHIQKRNVKLIDGLVSEEELSALYNATDCYISLHTGEGFGLTILEAMAHGCATIATAWSGNMDFADCNLNVDFDLVPVEDDYFLGNWAKPKQESAVKQVKNYCALSPEAKLDLSKRSIEVSKRFTFSQLTSTITVLI